MKVVRAPLRVSLFGGGCDRPSYYKEHGCIIISFAIDAYMHVIWNRRPTGRCRLSYSKVEELDTLRDAKHTLVQIAGTVEAIEEPCTLTIISDVPKGTGLGSSSSLTVCLCKLCGFAEGDIALAAYQMERQVSPGIGFQDFLPAHHGGFRIYRYKEPSNPFEWGVSVSEPLENAAALINEYGFLLYTDIQRDANTVLKNWDQTETLHRIKELADEVASNVDNWTPQYLGEMLNETWALKSSIPGVATGQLLYQHAQILTAGAYGAKLCGAGAGGCWFILVPPDCRQDVIDATGLREIPIQVAEKGVEMWEL